jgi:hypothetical protein
MSGYIIRSSLSVKSCRNRIKLVRNLDFSVGAQSGVEPTEIKHLGNFDSIMILDGRRRGQDYFIALFVLRDVDLPHVQVVGRGCRDGDLRAGKTWPS